MTADPIGLVGGINFYSYVGGEPVNQIDPEGLAVGIPKLPKWSPWGRIVTIGEKAIERCLKLPKCRSKFDELEKKAKVLCKKVNCKFHKDREGHKFPDPKGGVRQCAHYQIDYYIEGEKGKDNMFTIQWELPGLCWKKGEPYPTIEW